MVAQAFHGSAAAREWLISFAGRPLGTPQPGVAPLDDTHRAWHEREVFRGPPRAESPALAAESPENYDP